MRIIWNVRYKMLFNVKEKDVVVYEKDKVFCNFKRKFCRDVAKVFLYGIE